MQGKALKVGFAVAVVAAMGATAAWAVESPEMFMQAVNTNASKDKTISMKEVDVYAMKRFDFLNHNKDGTLSMSEIGERMTPAEFKAANTAHHGAYPSLSRDEFKAYVGKLFTEANVTVEKGHTAAKGTLSEKELTTPAGKKLIRLLE